jgi:predicted ATPase
MKYLFVDNFRGFTKTLMSVRDVNFLVGENSTGKTSILALIKLLDSPHFWLEQIFHTDEMKLGMFKDIVSVGSPDRSYFSIGFANTTVSKKDKAENGETSYAFLFTFVEEEGTPTMSHYTTVMMGEQLHVHFGRQTTKYKPEGRCELIDDYESVKKMFLSWADTHQVIGRGYTSMRIPGKSLPFVDSFLDDFIRKKRGVARSKELPFFIRRHFDRGVVWLAPIRTRPQRTYDSYRLDFSAEGEHTPYLIKKLLARRTSKQRKQAEKFIRFIEKFGKESGLFRSIDIRDYDRRITTSPFELDIILSREKLSVDNVGYGVSQALPIIVEIFARSPNTWFTLQQPEIHLHPRAQTALGDIIFELAILENKKFVIETHSDFTIDGFRLHYKKKRAERKPDAQIVFFERKEGGNNLYEIAILENGEISDNQPPAYREFFVKEQMRLLGF